MHFRRCAPTLCNISSQSAKRLAAGLLVGAILFVFFQVRHFHFINYDDPLYISSNAKVTSGLTLDGLFWAFQTTWAGNWHPLTWLSHMLDCQLLGLDAGKHHLMNLGWHILNTLMLFYLLNRLALSLGASWLVAMLFAIHPLNVETVAWVSERKNLLSTFWGLVALHYYLNYVQNSATSSYLGVIGGYCLSLLSKAMLVTLPFVLLLLDFYPLKRFNVAASGKGRRLSSQDMKIMLEKAPLVIISGCFSIIAVVAQKDGHAIASLKAHTMVERLLNGAVAYVQYLQQLIWPSNLALPYPYPAAISFRAWFFAVALLLVLTAVAAWQIRKRPYIVICWLFFLGTLVPVIGIVQVGSQAMADRYVYLPGIGIFILMAMGGEEIKRVWAHLKPLLMGMLILYLAGLAIKAQTQTSYWSDSFSLYHHTLAIFPESETAHFNLAVAYGDQHNSPKAVAHYLEALKVSPDDSQIHYYLAVEYSAMGETANAVSHYLKSIELNPKLKEAYNNLGAIYISQHQFKRAWKLFQKAIAIDPSYADAHINLGFVYAAQGRLDDAIHQFMIGIKGFPPNADVFFNIGRVFEQKGDYRNALTYYFKAAQLDRQFIAPINRLAVAFMQNKQPEWAKIILRQALKIAPSNPQLRKTYQTLQE